MSGIMKLGLLRFSDLITSVHRAAQREFEQVQAAIDALGKLDIWGCGR
jgi:hypothetical protein